MALKAGPRPHEWEFAGSTIGGSGNAETPVVIAVCKNCGVIRAEVAPPRREAKLDLTGLCERPFPSQAIG